MRHAAFVAAALLASCAPANSGPWSSAPLPAVEIEEGPLGRSEATPPSAPVEAVDPALPGPEESARFVLDVSGSMGQPLQLEAMAITEPVEISSEIFDRYGLVLSGRAALRDVDRSRNHALRPWVAFRVRRGKAILSPHDGACRILVADVPPRGGSVLGAQIAYRIERKQGTLPPAEPAEVVDLNRVEDWSWAGGKARYRPAFEDGPASFGILRSAPDVPVPPHSHEEAWEVIALLSASGRFLLPGDAITPEEGQQIDGGEVLFIAPGQRHGFAPSGEAPTLGLQLYLPPGPEQRFKELAAAP